MMAVRVALITGASSGIGAALARLLAQKGIALILSGRDEGRLVALAKDMDVPVTILVADLSQQESRLRVIETIQKDVPDLVINCAGYGLYGPAIAHGVKEQTTLVDVNATAVVELTLEAVRALYRASKPGIVCNVSSAAAFFACPEMATYGAAKALVNSFSVAVDCEMRKLGIRVLAACPGEVATRFRRHASKGVPQDESWYAMSAQTAAREIWKQIETKKRLRVFDWKMRWIVRISRFPGFGALSRMLLSAKIKARHHADLSRL